MRMLVLGAGLQGSACAYDLLQRSEVERVTLADLHPRRVPAFLRKKKDKRLVTARLDAKRGPRLRKLMRGHDAVMNALPYYFNYPVAKARSTTTRRRHGCCARGAPSGWMPSPSSRTSSFRVPSGRSKHFTPAAASRLCLGRIGARCARWSTRRSATPATLRSCVP